MCEERVILVQPKIEDESLTSDYYQTCGLPKRFEHPNWFKGYGSERLHLLNPSYQTSSSEYGKYPPSVHDIPTIYHPTYQKFTRKLGAAGMYRNYSLNTGLDHTY